MGRTYKFYKNKQSQEYIGMEVEKIIGLIGLGISDSVAGLQAVFVPKLI